MRKARYACDRLKLLRQAFAGSTRYGCGPGSLGTFTAPGVELALRAGSATGSARVARTLAKRLTSNPVPSTHTSMAESGVCAASCAAASGESPKPARRAKCCTSADVQLAIGVRSAIGILAAQ